MRNSLIIAFLTALTFTSFGQLKINSPYSRFGLGDLQENGTVANRAAGGIGASYGNMFNINNVNPAMQQRTKYTVYEFGIKNTTKTLQSSSTSTRNSDLNIDYLAISLPVSKRWNLGVGLQQYSSVNYNINTTNSVVDINNVPTTDKVGVNYTGNGGINQFYISNAYRVLQDTSSGTSLSLGLEASYLFGQIEKESATELFINSSTLGEQISFRNDNSYAGKKFKPGFVFRKEILYYNNIQKSVTALGKDTLLYSKSYSFKDVSGAALNDAIIGADFIIYPNRRGLVLDKSIRKEEDIDRLLDLFNILCGKTYGVYVMSDAKNKSNRELREEFIGLTSGTLKEDSISANVIDYTSKFIREHSGVFLNAGLAYDLSTTLNGKSLSIIERTSVSGSYISLDTTSSNQSISAVLPSTLSFGISIDKPEPSSKKRPSTWAIGADMNLTKWTEYSDNSSSTFNNTYKIMFGGEYTPDPLLLNKKSYLRRITYRGGVHYGTTPYSINNTSFNDVGINFGFTLPVGIFTATNPPKHLNLALALGQRGTTANNLIKEKYAVLSVSLNFNSRWFERYKLGL